MYMVLSHLLIGTISTVNAQVFQGFVWAEPAVNMSNNKNGSSDCNTNSEHGTKHHTGANSSIVTNVEAAANQQSHAEKLIPNHSDFVSPSPKHTRRA